MSKNLDIYIDQGSDFIATFPPITNPQGEIMDLTGYTVVCQIRRSYATIYAVQMTVDNSQFSSGVITITLSNAETAGLFPTRWVYDVDIIDTNGIITKVFEGLSIVNPSVSSKPDTTLLSPYIPVDFGGLL
jgi:hypothetical protein